MNLEKCKKAFVDAINYRDEVVTQHYGDNMVKMLEYAEERIWYVDHIKPLDQIAINLANELIDQKVSTIKEMFENQELKQIYLSYVKSTPESDLNK